MPFRTATLLFRRAPALPSITTRRALASTPSLRLKEDADRSPEQIEMKKQEQLKKQERGEGHWHEELASRTESDIAADRQEKHVEDHDEHMNELQKQTAKKGEKGELELAHTNSCCLMYMIIA
ncbi:hypothetical protein BU26DRAFT_604403 [Trematosphaeria pertusa]|uniref:Uncharacterized protein n=1 Tax=Trematosphaeria pertusa TaxID=390896 RepID=A0A6A6IJE6_9PLEO|nr:uncharacterized protein BU26DRAFT_604403 [Trematosphaeria pertusa]KAF2250178.1 hypothetical protein BU26DRAFT_604403 [Trematosphaeria pertusa]